MPKAAMRTTAKATLVKTPAAFPVSLKKLCCAGVTVCKVTDAAGGAVGVIVTVWTLPVKVMMEAKGLGVQEVVAGVVVDDPVVMVTGLEVLVLVATVVALVRTS